MKLSVLILVLLISACAENRFLTKEQDDEMRKVCESGCITVPVSVWQQIEQFFQQFKGAI